MVTTTPFPSPSKHSCNGSRFQPIAIVQQGYQVWWPHGYPRMCDRASGTLFVVFSNVTCFGYLYGYSVKKHQGNTSWAILEYPWQFYNVLGFYVVSNLLFKVFIDKTNTNK